MSSTFQPPSTIRQPKKINHHLASLAILPKRFLDPEDLIFVSKPYNRLQRIERTSVDSLKCIVFNEYEGACEGGPIGTAEVGRHIAILGSIQLAIEYNFGEKCFFLATGAELQRTLSNHKLTPNESNLNKKFHLSVKTVSAERKVAVVCGTVLDADSNEVSTTKVTYQVMRKGTFERLFSNKRVEGFSGVGRTTSPYGQDRRELTDIVLNSTNALGHLPLVEASDCVGHFPNYPCLPVAIVGNHLIQLGKRLFLEHTHNRYSHVIAEACTLEAKRLIFPGESVRFETCVASSISGELLSIDAKAIVDGEVVAGGNMLLRGLHA